MPGTDIAETVRFVVGECPQLPYLPELPARGPGADMVGRTAGLLATIDPGFAVQTTTTGWRFADRPGAAIRRAQSWVGQDLDALEEYAADVTGAIKVSLCGPWTLAANIELRTGDRALHDPGACSDLTDALVELTGSHVRDLARRLPNASIVVQVDEPSLSAVLTGTVSRQSGWGRLAPVQDATVVKSLGAITEAIKSAGGRSVIHCCADNVPFDALRRIGADGFCVDPRRVSDADIDALGLAFEAEMVLMIGIVPASDASLSEVTASVDQVRNLSHRIGFDIGKFVEQILLSPTCGMAAASPGYVRSATKHLHSVSSALTQMDDRDG